jgi:hypothetical protein
LHTSGKELDTGSIQKFKLSLHVEDIGQFTGFGDGFSGLFETLKISEIAVG